MKNRLYKCMCALLCAAWIACPQGAAAESGDFVKYKQEKLQLVDPQGDKFLRALFFSTCETGLKKCLLRENVPPQESQLRRPRFMKENPIVVTGVRRPVDNTKARPLFDTQAVLKSFEQIIKERVRSGHKIQMGKPHRWSADSFSVANVAVSKLLMALGTASSSRFMYVGQEETLIAWIKDQPDNSVTLTDLFRRSLALNDGNVYLTVLTIENVLSDATFEEDREYTAVNKKLADLYAASPNKFGDWYHFFGTMLAGYAGEPADAIAALYGTYRKISRGDAAEKATIAADKAGADIGIKLRLFMFNEDKELRAEIGRRMAEREKLSKASLGNLKHVGPDGNMYIGTHF